MGLLLALLSFSRSLAVSLARCGFLVSVWCCLASDLRRLLFFGFGRFVHPEAPNQVCVCALFGWTLSIVRVLVPCARCFRLVLETFSGARVAPPCAMAAAAHLGGVRGLLGLNCSDLQACLRVGGLCLGRRCYRSSSTSMLHA